MQSVEILVDSTEYVRLMERDEILTALEAAGVDNWEWYEDAVKGILK